MVPRDGIEPPTLCSSGTCSTTELPGLTEIRYSIELEKKNFLINTISRILKPMLIVKVSMRKKTTHLKSGFFIID